MEPKKYASSDIHRYRGLLFSSGLLCSLLIVILAFQWQVRKVNEKPRYDSTADPDPLYTVRPTVHIEPERPVTAPRRVTPAVTVSAADAGEIVVPAPEVELENFEPVSIEMPVEEPVEVFDWADEMPEPEGGYEAFYKLLGKEMRYPGKARATETEGRVFVRFTVDKDGTLRDFSVVKGIGAGCDEEALRVLHLTRWRPGRRDGRPVAVRMVQPIYFKLRAR